MKTDKLPEGATHELQNVTTNEVSLVDKPANKKPFLIVKSAKAASTQEPTLVEQFAQRLAALGKDASDDEVQAIVLAMAEKVGIGHSVEEESAAVIVQEAEVADVVKETDNDASDTIAKLDSILNSVEAVGAIGAALEKAHVDSLTEELSIANKELAMAKAELEAYQVSATSEIDAAIEKALANKQQEYDKIVEAKDAEISELTVKLASQAKELTKVEKRLGAAPQTQHLTALLRSHKSRVPSTDSQVVPAGEQTVEKSSVKDPWRAVEQQMEEDSSK